MRRVSVFFLILFSVVTGLHTVAQDAAAAAELDDLPHGEEVAAVVQLFDQLQLFLDLRLDVSRHRSVRPGAPARGEGDGRGRHRHLGGHARERRPPPRPTVGPGDHSVRRGQGELSGLSGTGREAPHLLPRSGGSGGF